MPLLRRQPFVKVKPPPNLNPDEEVYHCKLTNEIFRDYEAFFERIILCNSLVWTCACTGKSGLTYQEAVESEEKARKSLSAFPECMRRPMLCLAALTHRTRLNDVNEDVYVFAKDRFFIGELVEVHHRYQRRTARVIKVLLKSQKGDAGKKAAAVDVDSSDDDDVIMIEKPNKALTAGGDVVDLTLSDDESGGKSSKSSSLATSLKSSVKSTPSKSSPGKSLSAISPSKALKPKTLSPDSYNYMVQFLDRKETVTVKAHQVNRKKGVYTRDKSKLFLKQHCEAGDGIWRVRAKFVVKYRLIHNTFDEMFTGPRPDFVVATIKKRPPGYYDKHGRPDNKKGANKSATTSNATSTSGKKYTQVTLNEMEQARIQLEELEAEAEARTQKKKLTPEERAALIEKIKAERNEQRLQLKEAKIREMEELRSKRRAEKEQEKIKMIEERRIRAEYLREWSKIRDDLECDDLKPMPEPVPVRTHIPESAFGDALMLVEFFRAFSTIVDVSDIFPDGVTIGVIERILKEKEMDGALYDMVKALLTTIFELQDEEENINDDDMLKELSNLPVPEDDMSDLSMKYLLHTATLSAKIPYKCHGSSLSKLTLDQYTISEVVRLHLMSSGSRATVMNAKFRYQERGGYTSLDDAGLDLRMRHPELISHLASTNLYDLPPGDKMKILATLTDQIMSYAAARDIVDDYAEQLRMARADLRLLQQTEMRFEREEQSLKWRRRCEEKAREAEKIQQLAAQRAKELDEAAAGTSTSTTTTTNTNTNTNNNSNNNTDKGPEKVKEKKKEKEEESVIPPEDSRTSSRLKEKVLLTEEEEIRKKLTKKKTLDDLMAFNEEGLSEYQLTLLDERRKEVRTERREEIKLEQEELIEAITNLQFSYANYPLGRDRLFRRYWLFAGTDGLFVEDEEQYLPSGFIRPICQNLTLNPHTTDKIPESATRKLLVAQTVTSPMRLTSPQQQTQRPSVQIGTSVQLVPTIGGVQCGPAIRGTITTSPKVVPGVPLLKASPNGDKENFVNGTSAKSPIVISSQLPRFPIQSNSSSSVVLSSQAMSSSSVKLSPGASTNGPQTMVTTIVGRSNGGPQSPVKIVTLGQPNSSHKMLSPTKTSLKSPVKVEPPNPAIEQIFSSTRSQWSYFNDSDSINQLLASLNERGLRERELKNALMDQKDNIIKKIQATDVEVLASKSTAEEDDETEEKKSEHAKRVALPSNYRKLKSQGIVKDDSAQEQMELTLREMLLDMEERIYFGVLGTMNVKDRGLWRDAIEQGSYVAQIEPEWPGQLQNDDSEKMDTSCDDDDSGVHAVRDLSKGLLQVEQGIDRKYLNPPLGETDKEKKARQKEASRKEERRSNGKDDASSTSEESTGKRTTMENWEESLMSCTSLCQIYLHVATLESSIEWSKSALHARCRICRRKGDAEKMLLCDMCDKGHHMNCLKPALTKIPAGDWFCPWCRPKEVTRTPRKKRRVVESEDEEEIDSQQTEEQTQDSDMEEGSDVEEGEEVEEEEEEEEEDEDTQENSDEAEESEEDDEESQEVITSEEDEPEEAPKIKMRATAKKPAAKPASRRGTPVNVPASKKSSAKKPSPGSGTRRASRSAVDDSFDDQTSKRSSKGRNDTPPSRGTTARSNKRKSNDVNGVEDSKASKSQRLSDGGKSYSTSSSSRGKDVYNKLRKCEEIIQEMIRMDDAWPFLKPVSKKEVPDYYDIIKSPMDFSKIRMNLNNHIYTTVMDVVVDVRLMFHNCVRYNLPDSEPAQAGTRLGKYFETRIKNEKLIVTESKRGRKQ